MFRTFNGNCSTMATRLFKVSPNETNINAVPNNIYPLWIYCRFKAANILACIAIHYPKALEKKRLSFIRAFISLLLNLLMDDDPAIRHYSAKIVLHNLPDDIELGLSDCEYNHLFAYHIKIPICIESVVSTMAQRLFLQNSADILLAFRMDDNYILDIFKIIVTNFSTQSSKKDDGSHSSGENSNSSDAEVFEKNEANVFAEPSKVIFDAAVVFKNTFKSRLKITRFIDNFMQDIYVQGSAS